MSPKIPPYRYRGQDSKLPSAGDPVGNGVVGKSACYSGAPPLSITQARRTGGETRSAEPDEAGVLDAGESEVPTGHSAEG